MHLIESNINSPKPKDSVSHARFYCYSLSYHGQQHFESLGCSYGMRLIRGHNDPVTSIQWIEPARYFDFHFAFQHMHKRIKWRCMFTQLLSLIEGKQCDVAGLRLGDLAADHRDLLIAD